MTNLVKVTPVERTDPRSGETYWHLSRPRIDGPSLFTIFTEHLGGRMDLYQALTSVDGRLWDRRAVLSKAETGRARCVFRAIEKYAREKGVAVLPVVGREDAIDRQRTALNKYANDKEQAETLGKTPSEYWLNRANKAGRDARNLPRGKTGIRLADVSLAEDVSRIRDRATLNDQLSETYGDTCDQFASIIGINRDEVRRQRERAAENEAEQAKFDAEWPTPGAV